MRAAGWKAESRGGEGGRAGGGDRHRVESIAGIRSIRLAADCCASWTGRICLSVNHNDLQFPVSQRCAAIRGARR